jgi:ATP-dependent helicase/nuclease subunit A
VPPGLDDVSSLPAGDATLYAFRRNVFVAASAGTGKTYRLTALYVLLTLGLTSMGQRDEHTRAPHVTPERIVATTFSRAAAAEIASRVEAALRAIASSDEASPLPFGGVLEARAAALGQHFDRGELKKRAHDALGRWAAARIDTLHGVARRIVQRHGLTIGLAPGTRVLDEEEAQALSDLAVDEALGVALAAGGERAEAARALIASAGSVWSVRLRLQRMLDRLDEEGILPRELALTDHLADARVVASSLLALARRLASEASASLREPAAGLAAALAQAKEGELLPRVAVPSLVDLFTRRLPARSQRSRAVDELDDFIGALPGKTKQERAHGLIALLEHAPVLGAREVKLLDLIEDARARLSTSKRRVGALGFGDLLRVARDTLRDDAEIARAVREEVDVLLVDEFQDTSRVQRDLVYLLREREDAADARVPGAAPEARGLMPHGLFVVGDRKQSIYGFRGADVSVFSRIATELAGRPAARALALPEGPALPDDPVADFVALRESRRSGPGILSFVNAYATRDFVAPDRAEARSFDITYGPAEHLVAAEPLDPEIGQGRVVYVADDGTSPDDAEPIVRESAGAAREAHVAAAYVASITHGGTPAIPYKNVAVLARRRSTIPLVELALARLDIPYVVAGRALYDAPEVRDIAALLRLILDPRDRLAMAVVLRGPMVALSDTALTLLSIPGRGLSVPLLGRWPTRQPANPGDAVDPMRLGAAERARLEAFRPRFAEFRGAALRLPPGEAIRAAVAAFDLDRVLAALPRAEARIGNLDRLVTIARRRGGTLAGFVRWLERRMRDDADEAEAAVFSQDDDAVRLTTIHASKGLDFPVVLLVDLNAEPRADPGGIGFVSDGERASFTLRHYAPRGTGRALLPLGTAALRAAQAESRAREQAERRRLTYVAITRARQTLALVGSALPPRPSAALGTLATSLAQPDFTALVALESASALLGTAKRAPPRAARVVEIATGPRLRRPAPHDLVVDPAELALFRGCPRRYHLVRALGIAEPTPDDQLDLFAASETKDTNADLPPPIAEDPTLDPRPLHRAVHRVLARNPDPRDDIAAQLVREGLAPQDAETRRLGQAVAAFLGGSWFSQARQEGARLAWDEPFVVGLGGAPGSASVTLRGTCDLRVERDGGKVDVIAIATERALAARPAVDATLRAMALSVVRARPEAVVCAAVIHLDGPDPRPRPDTAALSADDHARFERDTSALARRFAEAHREGRFDGIVRPACERLRCGFVAACHSGAR